MDKVQTKPSILLIASQIPQQELGIIAQLLQSQGYSRQVPSEKQTSPSLTFETKDKANAVVLKFYQDIGALRLELRGSVSMKIGAALGQYMDVLSADKIEEFFDQANSDMERRIYAILLVLTYADATDAMAAMRSKYFDRGGDAVREGIVQGLAFLETPDVGTALEDIEQACEGNNIAVLARRAIDGLSGRGVIRESVASFLKKINDMIEETPKAALEAIEKYEAQGAAPAVRAVHARALRLLGQSDEAGKRLVTIDMDDPDAVDAFCERALLREAAGFTQQAMSDVQSALVIDAENKRATEIFSRLRLVLEQSGASSEDKIERFNKAIAENPDDPNLRCRRAECLLAEGKSTDAVKDLLAALKIAPNDPRLPLLLCEAYLAERYLGSALEQAVRAQKNHTAVNEVTAWLLKPRVFLAIGSPKKALNAIHEIPAGLRDDPMIDVCTGIVLEMLGHDDEARKIYGAHAGALQKIFNAISPVIYKDLPLLRSALGKTNLEIRTKPDFPLDKEPVDPYFKRCAVCGALTMKRRTNCRECGSEDFY